MKKIFFLFFLSGLASLICEVLWVRMLSLIFGTTTFALATVVTSFLAGLAVGSFYGGRIINKEKYSSLSLLKIYAYLEIAIGIYALFSPFIFKLVQLIYIKVYPFYSASFYSYSLLKFFICFILLLLPCAFMGATLPVLSKVLVKEIDTCGEKIGGLYSYNTFGGVLGVFLCGFFLLPYFGISATLYFAVLINFFIAGVIFKSSPNVVADLGLPNKKAKQALPLQQTDSNSSLSANSKVLLFAFLLSGFTSLLYEIVWTRALVLIVGTTVYAFSLVLAIFLLGIASGSFIISKFIDKIKSPVLIFGFIQLLIGIYILFSTLIFNKLPFLFFKMSKISGYNFLPLTLSEFLIIFLVLFIPTTLFGCLFPIMIKIYNKDISTVAEETGRIYSINTLGCILGSFICGFIFIPNLGIQKTIILGCLINILLSSVVFLDKYTTGKTKVAFVLVIILTFISARFIPTWNKQILSSDIFLKLNIFDKYEKGKILFYEEGTQATVAVVEKNRNVSLFINGKADASTGKRDMFTQKLLAHLPCLLHPQPQKILIIGMGSGVTLGTSLLYDIPQVDVVEIEPAVVKATKFFRTYTKNSATNPKVKIIIDDARNYLLATENKYDIIISEPSNLWIQGINNLFTKEFFEIAKSKLNSGGIFCQWLHTYRIKSDDLKIAAKTFSSVFNNITVWSLVSGDILLVGGDNKFFDYRNILKKKLFHPAISFDLYYMKAKDIYTLIESSFLLDTGEVNKFAENSIINTDNFPTLEFSVPKSIYSAGSENFEELSRYKRSSMHSIIPNAPKDRIKNAENYFYIGISHFAKENYILAIDNFEKAITLNNKYSDAYYWLGHSFAYLRSYNNAISAFKRSIGLNPYSGRAYYCLGMIYKILKKNPVSKQYLKKAEEIEPALSNPKKRNLVLNYVEGF